MNKPDLQRALIIGVSGATWDVLGPLTRSGRAPNIARLIDRGTAAPLASLKATGDEHFRPQVAWASLATACVPDRHGVTKFFHESAEMREPALWDFYANAGLASGIYGWPGVWPPPEIPGFVIPSHLGRDARTWPPALKDIKALDREQQALERDGSGGGLVRSMASAASTLLRYRVSLPTILESVATGASIPFTGREAGGLRMRKAKLEISADVFLELCRRYQPALAAFITFYVDFASHRYWRYREPSLFPDNDPASQRRFAAAVEDSYVALDRVVGRLLSKLGDYSVVGLISEHGMAPEPVSTELGRWRYSIRGSRVRELAGLPANIEVRPVARWFAFRPLSGAQLQDVAAKLRSIEVVETGLPLFAVYEHGDEVVIKLFLEPSVPRYATGDLESLTVRVGAKTHPFSGLMRRSGARRSAMHAEEGVFLLAGPGIRRGVWLERASVLDVAPTLLKAVGLNAEARFDGTVLDIFERTPAT